MKWKVFKNEQPKKAIFAFVTNENQFGSEVLAFYSPTNGKFIAYFPNGFTFPVLDITHYLPLPITPYAEKLRVKILSSDKKKNKPRTKKMDKQIKKVKKPLDKAEKEVKKLKAMDKVQDKKMEKCEMKMKSKKKK